MIMPPGNLTGGNLVTPDQASILTVSEIAPNLIAGGSSSVTIGNAGFRPVGNNIDAALVAAFATGKRHIIIPDDEFEISNTMRPAIGQWIRSYGRGCRLIPKAGGTFAGGRLAVMNGKNTPSIDDTDWQVPFPNMNSGGMEFVEVINPDGIAGLTGFLAFGGYVFNEIKFDRLVKVIERPTGKYTDSFELHRIIVQRSFDNSEYAITLNGLGDGLIIDGLHAPYDTGSMWSTKAVYVKGSVGGRISACIGGDYEFQNAHQINITDGHFEKSQFICDSSNINFRGTAIYGDDRVPIIAKGTFSDSNNIERFLVSLTDVSFAALEGASGSSGDIGYDTADVQVSTSVNLAVRNCYRTWTANGNISKSQLAGIKVQKDDATPLADWNNYAYAMSKNGRIGTSYAVDQEFSLATTTNSFNGIVTASSGVTSISSSIAVQWRLATGTYYYKSQLIYDPTRLVGRNQINAEFSIAIADTTKAVQLIHDFNSKPANGILRIYRGTASGLYDKYVDIHTIGSVAIYDNGEKANGHTWQSRTAGAVDSLNGIGETSFALRAGRAVVHAIAPPTVGAWVGTDQLPHAAPAEAGTTPNKYINSGWVNTASGSPGTFLQQRTLTGN